MKRRKTERRAKPKLRCARQHSFWQNTAPPPFASTSRSTVVMSEPVKKGQRYQNRESFKAHRNIKRAVRDVDAEAALKQQACAGVCRRCAQKVFIFSLKSSPLC